MDYSANSSVSMSKSISRINLSVFILACTTLFSCYPLAKTLKVETTVMKIDSVFVVKEDTTALRIIQPYKIKVDSEMKEILGYSEHAMIKDNPEGVLNNFVADIVLKKANDYYTAAKVDFCLLNSGGLRTALPKGAITRGKIFELMPFENMLIVVTLSGTDTRRMFDFIAKKGGMPISGFTMGMNDTSAVNILINGEPFDNTKEYRVVTSDYLANGGDDITFFANPVKFENTGIKVRDAIIEYMKEETAKGNTYKAKLDKRLFYE